jgi:HAD superfamily hydrolase (TIGR01490 family)
MTAVFDLDQTLTRRDTFLPFLCGYLRRHPLRAWRLIPLPLTLLAIMAAPKHGAGHRKQRRTRIKQAVLKAFLGGAPRAEVAAWGETYAERVAAGELRPGCLATLREHQAAGDRVVLATASFDVYTDPLARRLRIEETVCSRIAWDAAGRVAGIEGDNCRDHEKLRRVRGLLGNDGAGVVAYSDSHADLPLLTWAGRGVAVSPTRTLAGAAADLDLDIRRW